MKILLINVILLSFAVCASEDLFENYDDVEITVTSEPPGATVVFSDEEVGETPLVFRRPEGKYRIILIREHHKAYYEAVMVKAPEFSRHYVLEDLRACITVKSFNKAEIFINGLNVRNDCPVKLPAGEYNVKVEMKGARTLEKDVVLDEKENKLFILYPDAPTGMLNFSVNPSSACIEVWEEGVDKYCAKGSKAFSNLPEGRYLWRAGCRGYKTVSGETEILHGNVSRLEVKLEKGTDIGGEYVEVKGGNFMMGGSEFPDELPARKVILSDFMIGKYEITQSEWNYVMGTDVSFFKNDSLPVENVSWFDAVEFCNRLSEMEGLDKCYATDGRHVECDFSKNGYRLPTEAEWEFAAKGGRGGGGYRFSGSDDPLEVALFSACLSCSTKCGGCRKPNALGVYDMSGNVGEWCWDWYGEYPEDTQKDPRGPAAGHLRTVRGGSWLSAGKYCTNEFRNLYDPGQRLSHIGFRVVRSR